MRVISTSREEKVQAEAQRSINQLSDLQQKQMEHNMRQLMDVNVRIQTFANTFHGREPSEQELLLMRNLFREKRNYTLALRRIGQQAASVDSQRNLVNNLAFTTQYARHNKSIVQTFKKLNINPERLERSLEDGQEVIDNVREMTDTIESYVDKDSDVTDVDDELAEFLCSRRLSSVDVPVNNLSGGRGGGVTRARALQPVELETTNSDGSIALSRHKQERRVVPHGTTESDNDEEEDSDGTQLDVDEKQDMEEDDGVGYMRTKRETNSFRQKRNKSGRNHRPNGGGGTTSGLILTNGHDEFTERQKKRSLFQKKPVVSTVEAHTPLVATTSITRSDDAPRTDQLLLDEFGG